MVAMSTTAGASVLAHGLHYAMVLLGLWGLAALLLPYALTRVLHAKPVDQHASRVAELRAAFASGAVGVGAQPAPPPARSPRAAASDHTTDHTTDETRATALSVPLALVASAAAAGIHAAVAPPHLREQAVAGAFFLAVAGAQVAWAVAAQRPTPRLLRIGILLNVSLIGLWLLTRATALPFGLQAEPHPVGPWDLTCVAWEVAAVAACTRALRDGVPARCPGWFAWHPSTRSAVGLAAVTLVLLTLSGAHA